MVTGRKNSHTTLLLILGFIWTLSLGALVTWFIIYHTNLFDRKPPEISAEKPMREEYDVLLVSKTTPHKLLYIDYYKKAGLTYGNAHFYDGVRWEQGAFRTDVIKIQPLVSLNNAAYSINGIVKTENETITFIVPEIHTHMTVRAEDDYSKFGGATNSASAGFTVGAESFESYAALLAGYNSQEDVPDWMSLGVHTDWLMYFDKNWNFYHLDKTSVDKFSSAYASHSFFATSFGDTVDYIQDFDITGSTPVFSVTSSGLKKLNLTLGEKFNRIDYNGTSWGGLALGDGGGLGVYLTIDTH